MLRTIRIMAVAIIAVGASSTASAQIAPFDPKNLFFGAGLSQNKVSGSDNGTGFQIFGGYSLGELAPKLRVDVEAGYMETGRMEKDVTVCVPFFGCSTATADAEAKGLWTTGVARYMIQPKIELIGRAGLDLGDDDGPMFGVGAGYLLDNHITLRGEIVKRDEVTSLQFNAVYRF